MRMWMVNPRMLCKQHLMGEHVELHMAIGSLKRGHSVDGFIEGGLMNVNIIYDRHTELVKEMLFRGYNHQSPIHPDEKVMIDEYEDARSCIDIDENIIDLITRCPHCKKRYESLKDLYAEDDLYNIE